MKKKLLLTLSCLLLVSGCGAVKLTNGENAVVTFKDVEGISTEELYQEMKSVYGAEKIEELIDYHLLSPLYKETEDEKDYVKEHLKNVETQAKSMGADLDLYLTYYYGVASEEAYVKSLSLDYKRDLWAKDYAKEEVSEKQIDEYYETQVIGDIEASQILITVNTNDDDKEEDKTKKEEEALKKANEVIEKLKNGEDFANLAKEYSEDELTSKNGGSLGFVNKKDVNEEVINALQNMKDGSYSESPVKSEYGYYILYRTSQKEKSELNDDLTNEIKDTIAKETIKETNYTNKALKALREKYEMKIEDDELNKKFESLITRKTAN